MLAMHIVIDHNQRGRLIDALDGRDLLLDFYVGKAGGGLIQQNEPRLVGEHGADLDKLPLTILASSPTSLRAMPPSSSSLKVSSITASAPSCPAGGVGAESHKFFADG